MDTHLGVAELIDYITILLQTAARTARLLERLDKLLMWTRMRVKPAKPHCLSIRKEAQKDNISF